MESTYSDPAVRAAIREATGVIDPSFDVADLIDAGALAIAQTKYNGKPNYAVAAQPTRSDARYAAAAMEAAFRIVAAQIKPGADPALIAAYLEDAAESMAQARQS